MCCKWPIATRIYLSQSTASQFTVECRPWELKRTHNVYTDASVDTMQLYGSDLYSSHNFIHFASAREKVRLTTFLPSYPAQTSIVSPPGILRVQAILPFPKSQSLRANRQTINRMLCIYYLPTGCSHRPAHPPSSGPSWLNLSPLLGDKPR